MQKNVVCYGSISQKPLKAYADEYDALTAARYVESAYRKKMVYYKCPNCGFYHLSPKERATPSKTSTCLSSNGQYKESYPSLAVAKQRAKIVWEEEHLRLYPYHCPRCLLYHLSHKKGRDSL